MGSPNCLFQRPRRIEIRNRRAGHESLIKGAISFEWPESFSIRKNIKRSVHVDEELTYRFFALPAAREVADAGLAYASLRCAAILPDFAGGSPGNLAEAARCPP